MHRTAAARYRGGGGRERYGRRRALGAIQRALCDDKAQKSAHFSILGFGRLNGKWSAPSAVGARYHRPGARTPARPSPRARSEVQERSSVGSGAQRSARALVARARRPEQCKSAGGGVQRPTSALGPAVIIARALSPSYHEFYPITPVHIKSPIDIIGSSSRK
jgi:hypothetical protein